MIRSTKINLKFANTARLKSVHQFIDDYKKLVIQFIDYIHNRRIKNDKIKTEI